MREIIGFHAGDSILAPGGSISNMYALIIARHRLFPQHKHEGMRAIHEHLVVYTSEEVNVVLFIGLICKQFFLKRSLIIHQSFSLLSIFPLVSLFHTRRMCYDWSRVRQLLQSCL